MATQIYGLFDPRYPNDIRYVGKTVLSLKTRLSNHIYKAHSGRADSHSARWIRELLGLGIRPDIALLEQVQGEAWQAAERRWISRLDRLLNQTPGGNGAHSRVVLDDGVLSLLGVVSDARIAEQIGCSREFIGYERRKRGIPASGDRSRVKPPEEGRPKIRLEQWVVSALGTVTDTELAEKAGVSTTTIWARRVDLGIPSYTKHRSPPVRRGAGHHNAKLTWDTVKEIRVLHASGMSQRALASRFDVHISTVNSVVHHKTWRDDNGQ